MSERGLSTAQARSLVELPAGGGILRRDTARILQAAGLISVELLRQPNGALRAWCTRSSAGQRYVDYAAAEATEEP
jgi:hypothetical protein